MKRIKARKRKNREEFDLTEFFANDESFKLDLRKPNKDLGEEARRAKLALRVIIDSN